MKTKKTKKSSYKRYALLMLLSAICGAALGMFYVSFLDGERMRQIEDGIFNLTLGLQRYMTLILTGILLVSVISGEMSLRKQKRIGRKIREAEDEDCDRWEYEEEKVGAWGSMLNILSLVLSVLVLSVGYSMEYIGKDPHGNALSACVVFLMCYAYDGFWQARFVKGVQEIYPEKKGDISRRNFHQQWLESCDEAEKEIIYRSAYQSYLCLGKFVPILLMVTMLGNLFFQTGVAAVAAVAAIWLVSAASYIRTGVSLRGKKIRG